MMLFKIAAAASALFAAGTASAVTYDFADVGAPLTFAQYDGGASFTAFTPGCPARPDLANCFEGPDGAGNSQVVYNNGNLIAHPGTNGTTAVLFTAPGLSNYTFSFTATLLDPNGPGTDGVTVSAYISGFPLLPVTTLTPPVGGPTGTITFASTILLAQGDQIGLVFGNNGSNFNDSVLLSGFISYVPEPATWAMMIGGVAAAGGALRRRKAATVRFA